MINLLPKLFFVSLLFLAGGMLSPGLYAQEDPEARRIYEEMDGRQKAIVFETSTLNMLIIDSRGRTRTREMQSWSYNEGDLSNSLIRFNTPADVRGTGLLTLDDGTTEVQKLFLPALNRIQTIAASQKADRFMGSDFTYEDLGGHNPDDFIFTTLERNPQNQTIRIKGAKKTPSDYAYVHYLIDTERYVLISAVYYNVRNEALRELKAEEFTELKPQNWRAQKLTMHDLKASRRTELVWTNRILDEPFSRDIFTERNLMRAQ